MKDIHHHGIERVWPDPDRSLSLSGHNPMHNHDHSEMPACVCAALCVVECYAECRHCDLNEQERKTYEGALCVLACYFQQHSVTKGN